MQRFRARVRIATAGLAFAGSMLAGSAGAEVFYLRSSCAGQPTPCYTSISSLNAAVTPRTAANPLIVDIGPGDFPASGPLSLTCNGTNGFVTYRGAGREHSRIVAANGGVFQAAVLLNGCQRLGFQDLTVVGRRYGVIWFSNGTSTWTNVDVVMATAGDTSVGWTEEFCSAEDPGDHYWFSSRIRVTAKADSNAGYSAPCARSWFFGSEIDVIGDESLNARSNPNLAAVTVSGEGEVQAFGSLIRARSAGATTAALNGLDAGVGLATIRIGKTFAGADAAGGMFHAHGTNLTANAATNPGRNATVLDVRVGAAMAHTFETSFVATPGAGGTGQRILKAAGSTAMLQSPFQWEATTAPPVDASENGLDSYVETDCASTGNCNGGGTQTHLMIYNPAHCGAGNPWFNVVTGRCRNL